MLLFIKQSMRDLRQLLRIGRRHLPAVLQYGAGAILIVVGMMLIGISLSTSILALFVGFVFMRLDAIRFYLQRHAREREMVQMEYAGCDPRFAEKYIGEATSFEPNRFGKIDTLTDPRNLAPANALVVSKLPTRRDSLLGKLIDRLPPTSTIMIIALIFFIPLYYAATHQ